MPSLLALTLPLTHSHEIFLIVFGVVLVAPLIARPLRLPGIVLTILAGVLIGPNALGILARSGVIEVLGTAGLLYIMFQAGLELDLDDFRANRANALWFGVLTGTFPFVIGTLVHSAIGYSMMAALLMGSCWSSHTLLSYPIFQRYRVTANRAVAVGVGGTIVVDTAALLILVALAKAHGGDLTWSYALLQIPVLTAAAFILLRGLPRLGAWFFSSIGRDRSTRFVFVMVALFAASLLSELAGVEPIIGAFLAGMAMNRLVVEESDLSAQIHFVGSNLLIPLFLLSVGMLVDPAALGSTQTLGRAAAFIGVVVVGKGLAAIATGMVFRFNKLEILTLFSLSVPQAAATLAVVFVGYDIGLLDDSTVNPVILVILVTCTLGSVVAGWTAPKLPSLRLGTERLGRRVLVPLSPENSSPPSIEVAAALASTDGGTVIPLTVLDLDASAADVRQLRETMARTIERNALSHGSEARAVVRLDLTPASGILHASVEHEATCIVMEWDGANSGEGSVFGHKIDAITEIASVPVIVFRANASSQYERIVVVISSESPNPDGLGESATIDARWLLTQRLAQRLRLPVTLALVGSAPNPVSLSDLPVPVSHIVTGSDPESLLINFTTPSDLVILPATFAALEGMADRGAVAIVLPRAERKPQDEPRPAVEMS